MKYVMYDLKTGFITGRLSGPSNIAEVNQNVLEISDEVFDSEPEKSKRVNLKTMQIEDDVELEDKSRNGR